LNRLNSSLQGLDSNVLTSTDKLGAFRLKVLLWRDEVEINNSIQMFPEAFKVDPGAIVLRDIVAEHLECLERQLHHYFPSLDISKKDWIRHPFGQDLDLSELTLEEKEELIEVKTDRTLQLRMPTLSLSDFWMIIEREHSVIDAKAIDTLLPFTTTYLCEKGFSSMTMLKTKYRERLLSLEDDMRICLSAIPPRIESLSASRANVHTRCAKYHVQCYAK